MTTGWIYLWDLFTGRGARNCEQGEGGRERDGAAIIMGRIRRTLPAAAAAAPTPTAPTMLMPTSWGSDAEKKAAVNSAWVIHLVDRHFNNRSDVSREQVAAHYGKCINAYNTAAAAVVSAHEAGTRAVQAHLLLSSTQEVAASAAAAATLAAAAAVDSAAEGLAGRKEEETNERGGGGKSGDAEEEEEGGVLASILAKVQAARAESMAPKSAQSASAAVF